MRGIEWAKGDQITWVGEGVYNSIEVWTKFEVSHISQQLKYEEIMLGLLPEVWVVQTLEDTDLVKMWSEDPIVFTAFIKH